MRIHHPAHVLSLIFSNMPSVPPQIVVGLDNRSIYRYIVLRHFSLSRPRLTLRIQWFDRSPPSPSPATCRVELPEENVIPAALLSLSIPEGQLLDWTWMPDEDSCILMHRVGLLSVRAQAKAWGTQVIVAIDRLWRVPWTTLIHLILYEKTHIATRRLDWAGYESHSYHIRSSVTYCWPAVDGGQSG